MDEEHSASPPGGLDNPCYQPTGKVQPDFFIIGAAKSGTTTLYSYLVKHPRIGMSMPKEPCYFAREDHYAKGPDWYDSLFPEREEGMLLGDASTRHSRYPTYMHAAERIKHHAPDAKFIYILRHPVDAFYSFYAHRMREGVDKDLWTFAQTVPEATHSCKFIDQINDFNKYFDRDRMLVLFTDDLKHDAPGVLERAQQHIGVEPVDLSGTGDVTANNAASFQANRQATERIDKFKKIPLLGSATKLVPKSLRHKAYQTLSQSSLAKRWVSNHRDRLEALTPENRAKLLEIFTPSLIELEEYLGVDLSHWKR